MVKRRSRKIIDITGQKFSRLTVLSFYEKDSHNHSVWECLCDCGEKIFVPKYRLVTGNTKSCGCLKNELIKMRTFTHGLSKDALYSVWSCMKKRCNNSKTKFYKNYGGRGIKVCEEWNSFVNFYQRSISNGYKTGLELDRKDNDGDYSPDNCWWVTCKQNCRNKRNNHLVTIGGVTKTLIDWSEYSGISFGVLARRINDLHWNPEDLLKPVKKPKSI